MWSNISKQFCFGIAAPTVRDAKDRLFRKIGKDAYKWRFEYKRIPDKASLDQSKLTKGDQST